MTALHCNDSARRDCLESECAECGDPIVPAKRAELGYTLCLQCGDKQAKQVVRTVVPMAKSNYIVVTDRSLLRELNKYANT